MNALIIVAHGSRRKESAQQVAALCQKLSKKVGILSDQNRSGQNRSGQNKFGPKNFDLVVPAFLQFSSPLLEEVIEDLVQRGIRKIIVFPFFIAAGSHLLKDIPESVEKAGNAHPGVDFTITRHLGVIDSIEDIILKEVESHLNSEK